jgi:hypothetical protein
MRDWRPQRKAVRRKEVQIMKAWIFAALAAALFVVGCSSNPMVGTWKLELPAEMQSMVKQSGGEARGDMVFKGDNTFKLTMHIKAMGTEQNSTIEGTYKLEGKDLTLTATKMDGKATEGKDKEPQKVVLADDMKSFTDPKLQGMKFIKQ